MDKEITLRIEIWDFQRKILRENNHLHFEGKYELFIFFLECIFCIDVY